jgi:hypothetical chaperone protein
VFFVDDDPRRDALAQATLEKAARAAGFAEVRFQFEPIAAAFDYERGVDREQRVLVADIGGGTSDFSLVRVGPSRRERIDRRDDILATHGVHVAGTDFDRRIELAALMPLLGLGARGPVASGAREVPSVIYHDLATWHLINTCYRLQRVAELRSMGDWYADAALHRRLMRVLAALLGAALFAALVAASWPEFQTAYRIGEYEGEGALRVPTWPVRAIIIALSALTVLAYLWMIALDLAGRLHNEEEAPGAIRGSERGGNA